MKSSRRTLPRMNSCPAATMESGSMKSPPSDVDAASLDAPVTSKSRRKSSHVRVVARIRPLSAAEQRRGYTECVFPLEPNESEQLENGPSVAFALSPGCSSAPGTPIGGGRLCQIDNTPRICNGGTQGATNTEDEAGSEPSSTTGRRDDINNSADRTIPKSLIAGTTKKKQFDYDAVFGVSTSQKEVYDQSVGDAVRGNLFKGYNTTIIAYGQTGSGKTYTMDGPSDEEAIDEDTETISPSVRPFRSPTTRFPPSRGQKFSFASSKPPEKRSSFGTAGDDDTFILSEEDGIIPRAVSDLFEAKHQHQQSGVKIHLTFMEIYNDEIRDLLADDDSSESIQLRDNGKKGVIIKGMSSIEVQSHLQAKELMNAASIRRTTGYTKANARSSRSHAICVLNVTISQGKIKRKAKLTLVDLAGSERLKQTGAEGLQQQEGIQINRDLFVLAKVVTALSDRSKQGRRTSVSHIPYRDCKLTRILKDSLGGNCCTVMVACISPTNANLEESINTLRYAERTRAITNVMKQNIVKNTMTSAETDAMVWENKMLKRQIVELMERLKELQPTESAEAESGEIQEEIDLAETQALAKGEQSNAVFLNQNIFFETFQLGNDDGEELLSLDDTASYCDQTIDSSIIGFDESVDNHVAEKRELLESLEGGAVSLQEKIESLKIQHSDLKTDVNAATSQKQQLEDEIKEMKASQKRIQNESASMKHQVRILACERTELLEEIEECQELNAMISLLNEEQDARRQAEDEVKKLRDHAASRSEDLITMRDKLAQSEGEALKLKADIMALNASLQQVKDNGNEEDSIAKMLTESEVLKLRAEVKSLTRENASLKQKWHERENEDSISEMLTKSEVLKLRAEVKSLFKENVALRRQLDGKENTNPIRNDSSNNNISAANYGGVLGERSTNVDDPPASETPVKDIGVDSFVKESPAFDSDSESAKSEQRAIRIHAAKMLFYANRSIEKKGGFPSNSSQCSSIGSRRSSDTESCNVPAESMSSKKKKKKKRPGIGNLRKRLSRKNQLPPKPAPRNAAASTQASDIASVKEVIDGGYTNPAIAKVDAGSTVKDDISCTCSSPVFTKNADDMDFYLPKLSVTCTCGKGANEEQCFVVEPLDLVNILRPWQVEFLASVNVTSAEELIWAKTNDAHRICRAMKVWRELKRMKPVTPKSCAIALHVWTKTAKVVHKSVMEQKAMGNKVVVKPSFLDVSFTSNADSSFSTIGCESAQG